MFVIKDNMKIKYNNLSMPLKIAVTWALIHLSLTIIQVISIIGYAITG